MVILRRLFSFMPNKCENCNKVVTNASEAKEIKCIGCNTALCANCNNGKACICKSCATWVREIYNLPEEFLKKNYKKEFAQ